MKNLDLHNKRVLIRADLNVPMDAAGSITSDIRITATLPTILQALHAGAKVIVMSHLGRPTEGASARENAKYSLAPVATYLSHALKQDVLLISDYLNNFSRVITALATHDVVLLENVRFNQGELANDPKLAKQYAGLCDIFVMDAFGSAHRAQASTHGVALYAPTACAGPLLTQELDAINQALVHPAHPIVAIVGGSKVSSKLTILENLAHTVLADNADVLVVGGGIANTFLAARGFNVGASLYEKELVPAAKALLAKLGDAKMPLPVDVVVATEFSATAQATVKEVSQVRAADMILDIGPQSRAQLAAIIHSAKTIIWNGPVGVFEFAPFEGGTKALAAAVASSSAFSLVGGGDTIAAVDKYKITQQISYISTGGGAFLEMIEGKTLPAVAVLEEATSNNS